MKAWLVREKDEFCATVVFAETRNKAKVQALSTDCYENAKYRYIEARRVPQMDKYYADGKREMHWENPQDRVALVKECNFVCDPDYFMWEDCECCSAKEYCDKYAEREDGADNER